MGTPFLGELKVISWNFAPQGWAFCNGQLLPINQNQALFSILGTTYGGDGRVNFGLPDLRGRVPLHTGQGLTLGQKAGEEFHKLVQAEMPAHNHFVGVNTGNGNNVSPQTRTFASFLNGYRGYDNLTTMAPATVGNAGGSQPHENRQPFLTLNVIIALQGIFPSQN